MEKLVRIFVLVAVLLTAATATVAVEYKAIILHPSGLKLSYARGISGEQQVGYGLTDLDYHALLWSGTGESYTDIHPSGFSSSFATGICGGGQVGYGLTGLDYHALLWSGTAESAVDLHPIGFTESFAQDICGGQQVGYGIGSASHALMWSGTPESVVDLHPSGFTMSKASSVWGIKQVGWGKGSATDYKEHALLWSGTAESVVDLHPSGFAKSYAFGISGGQQAGYGLTGSYFHALLWSGTVESVVDLHPIGFRDSWARGVCGGQQVGTGGDSRRGNFHALLWSGTAESVVDLHSFLPEGYVESRAFDIDSAGRIVGVAYTSAGDKHAVLWVPEGGTPPVADADGPYTVYVGDTLTLDASGSTDADNDIVSYMWDLDDDGSFETDTGGQAIFDVNYTYLQSLGLIVDNTYDIHVQVTDSEGQSDVADSTLTIIPKRATVVAVDIKPGSCPNPLNVDSGGVFPVAILGSQDFDVNTIDIASIRLADVAPIRSSFEDVATPVSDSNDCNCITDGPDGFLDLTLKFKTQRIVEAVGDVNDGDVFELPLTGVLSDETPIEGADCILIRGRHKPINPADINKDGVVNAADFAIFTQNWLQSSIVDE